MYKADELNLSMDTLPKYMLSAYRKFVPKERHITRTIPENVLILMVSGSLYFTEDGVDTLVQAGEYYIQKGGFRQSCVRQSELPYYYYVHFEGEMASDIVGLKGRGKFDFNKIEPIIDALEKIKNRPDATEVEKNGLFYNILNALHHVGKKDTQNPFAEKVLEIIINEFNTDVTVEKIAKRLYSNKNRVIEEFKSEYGITPKQYILKLRLNLAKRYLLQTHRTAKIIAKMCGFTDFSVFFKQFTKQEGLSPSQWKKANGSHN